MIRILFLSFICIFSLCEGTEYLIKDMGLFEEGESRATGINDRGEVVGIVRINDVQKVFLWSPRTGRKILDDLPQGAYAMGINNRGEVWGQFFSLDGWWSPKWVMHVFRWSEERGYDDLGAMDSMGTAVACVNDLGQATFITTENQCYFWNDWDKTKLDEASNVVQHGDLDLICARMNDTDLVFLKKGPKEKKGPQLFKMDLNSKECTRLFEDKKETPYPTTLTKEGKLGGFFTTQGKYEGFILSQKELTTIPNFRLNSMNDQGLAVGTLILGKEEYGALYKDDKLLNINDLMLPSEKQPLAFERVISLKGINRDGQMIGVVDSWNTKQAVLLIPQ